MSDAETATNSNDDSADGLCPISIVLRVVLVLFGLASILATYWQLNDPDAVPWIFAYTYCAALCLAGAFGYSRIPLLIIGMVIYLPWSIGLYIGLEEKGIKVEEWRESMGLLLAAAAMVMAIAVTRMQRSDLQSLPEPPDSQATARS